MHRPIRPSGLAELPCAVKRIHDPDATSPQTRRIVDALLRQHRVIGPQLGEQPGQQDVRDSIAFITKPFRIRETQLGAELHQSSPSRSRTMTSQLMIAVDDLRVPSEGVAR